MENERISFVINHLDSLGQGVAKQDDKIYFIKKTLPGEKGEASFLAKSKGVHFYKLEHISEKSPLRQNAQCQHFQECGGCDYLHLDYQNELKEKEQQITRLFQKIPRSHSHVNIHGAPRRFNYRNRIQLHYNKKANALGFLNLERKIFQVTSCPVALDEVNHELMELQKNENWQKLAKNAPNEGHIEIYQQKVTINRAYADGGFTQVYAEMNQVLKNIVTQNATFLNFNNAVIDLFGGNGNFSRELPFFKKWVIDFYKKAPESSSETTYTHQDLYHREALAHLSKLKTKMRLPETELLIVDPPRSGLKNLNEYLQLFFPKKVIYISCQVQSLIRDISNLHSSYECGELHLVDLFPGTHHYETVLIINRKDC